MRIGRLIFRQAESMMVRRENVVIRTLCALFLSVFVVWTAHGKDQEKTEPKAEPKKALSEQERVLLNTNDSGFKAIGDKKPIAEPLENPEEFRSFSRVLLHARSLTPELLHKYAQPSVPYKSLVGEEDRPNFLRGLFNVKGKLVNVVNLDLPDPLKNAGVKRLTAGWIEVEGDKNQMVCVIFTERPKDLRPGMRISAPVEVDGFYFKLLEYSVPKDVGMIVLVKKYAPLLLTRTIDVHEVEAPAPPANMDEADRIKLDRKDPLWDFVIDKTPVGTKGDNPDEYNLYNLVFKKTHEFSADAFARQSRKDIVYADLIENIRIQFLRELIHIEGTLVRLRKRDATERLKDTTDIKQIYEGWIVHSSNEEHLFNVVFTELPEGIKPGEKINYKVSFDGYYFKLLAYETKEKNQKGENQWRVAPLLIGRSVQMLEPEPSIWSLQGNALIPAILMGLGFLAVAVIGLTFWFRRGDKKVHSETRQALTKQNPFGQEPEELPTVEPGSAWNRIEEPPTK